MCGPKSERNRQGDIIPPLISLLLMIKLRDCSKIKDVDILLFSPQLGSADAT